MLKTLLFIVLLLKYPNYNDNQDIIQRNQKINRAELLIVRDSISFAIELYEHIIRTEKLLSNKDLYNLSICYLKVGDPGKAKVLIDSLISDGVEIDFLMKNHILAKYFSRNQFSSTIKNKRNSLKDSLNLIFKNDQIYRTTIYKNSGNSIDIRRADSINNQILLKIVADYKGLPDERAISSHHVKRDCNSERTV